MYISESKDGNLIRNLLTREDLSGLNPFKLTIPSPELCVSNPLIRWLVTFSKGEAVGIVQLNQRPKEVQAHIGVISSHRHSSRDIFELNKQFIQTNYPGIRELVCVVTMSTPNTIKAVKFLSKMGCQFSGIDPTGYKFILGL